MKKVIITVMTTTMKTHLFGKYLLLFGFMSLMILSCSKKDDTVNPVVVPPGDNPSPTAIGAILDSGVVNADTRVMKMALNTQSFTLFGSDETVSYASAKVKVAFYVNNDGSIPSGDYNFSSSDSKAPFTFDSGELVYVPGGNSNNAASDQIVDGTIAVSQQGNKYTFSFQINLASGMTASQIYSGFLDYADSK